MARAGAHVPAATQVFDVRGTLTIPIFQGGSVHGDILQADARLEQSQERLDNLRAQIDSDVRTALLNLQSSADLVNVARSNIDLAEETLTQSRDRFGAGVTDTVEVVQAQEAVASAHEQYISSLYNYNLAKFPWRALWAPPKRASKNISKENKHGGREPSPVRRRTQAKSPRLSRARDEHRVCAAGVPQAASAAGTS